MLQSVGRNGGLLASITRSLSLSPAATAAALEGRGGKGSAAAAAGADCVTTRDLTSTSTTSSSSQASGHAAKAAPLPQQAAKCAASAAAGSRPSPSASPALIQWVFLGAPGVGKGTYASRAAKHYNAAHIATGDLIRAEIKAGTKLGAQVSEVVRGGGLVPDDLIFEMLERRLALGRDQGEKGFILDGFPRTRVQAEKLVTQHVIQVAFNLGLREEVLVEKCLGRRSCSHCGKGYNIADIHLAADPSSGRPQIIMPPLSPPPECEGHLETREDDTEPVIRRRLEIYKQQALPVEDFFRQAGLLRNFEITGGIPETLPSLLATLAEYVPPSSP